MLRTWILIGWRNYYKHRSFSFLNIAGLSLGIACQLAILLYVLDEFKFDSHHEKAARIYRINAITNFGGQQNRYATTSAPLAEAIKSDVPGVEKVSRMFGRQATIQIADSDNFGKGNENYLEDNFFFADPDITKILSFTFLEGSAETALSNPNKIAISRRIAIKYFGNFNNAVGKQIQFEGTIPLEVSAVFEDLPTQSSYTIELIGHFENYFNVEREGIREFLKRDWMYNPVTTIVLLKVGDNAGDVQKKIQALNIKYADERVQQSVTYELQPFLKIHLYSDISFTGSQNAIRNVQIFLAIGLLILLIACINFINLSTVHSLKRAKEIGIRKVMGAMKNNLASQFLAESLILVLFSVLIAVLMVTLILPQINLITGKVFTFYSILDTKLLTLLFLIFIVTGLAAGLYPSIFISRFNPVAALKGLNNSSSKAGLLLRRSLVVVQFTSSIVLIISAVVIYLQMKYVQERPLGFEKDFMVTIPLFSYNPNSILGGGVESELRGRMNNFETEVLKNPGVEAVTVSSVLPGQGAVPALIKTEKIRDEDNVFIPVISVDYDFLETYKMQLLAGRNFNRQAGTDHLEAVIANEEAIKLFEFASPEKAIGQRVEVLGKNAVIIGVIRDYHFEGLQQSMRPLLLEVNVNKFMFFSLRVANKSVSESIDLVKAIWDTFFPEKVFEFEFLDVQLRQRYEREQRFANLINFFSCLAVFISSLGLFGLAAYIGHQKQKEAGVRKVLGANTAQVFYSLSREFMIILLIATLISAPLGYLLSDNWLNNFAFRIPIGWMPFAISFICTGVAVLVATAYQTYKAASVNPVEILRNE